MSVIDKLNNLFSKKTPDSMQSMGMSLAMPDDMQGNSRSTRSASLDKFDSGPNTQAGGLDAAQGLDNLVEFPVLGRRTVGQHQRTIGLMLLLSLVVLAVVAYLGLNSADRAAQQVNATGQSLMQSQRLAKSVSQALVGVPTAFPEVKESSEYLLKSLRGLQSGNEEMRLEPLEEAILPDLGKIMPLIARAETSVKVILSQQQILTQVGSALRLINRQSSDLLEVAETISSLKLQQNSPVTEISAAGQLVMLTQRIGKSSNEFLTTEGVSPEAVFLLGKDLNSFKEVAQGLLDGSPELRLSASKDPQTREQLTALLKLYEQTRSQAGSILSNLQGLVAAAREPHSSR